MRPDVVRTVKVNSVYISEVFMGYRRFPHVVVAVYHRGDTGDAWGSCERPSTHVVSTN